MILSIWRQDITPKIPFLEGPSPQLLVLSHIDPNSAYGNLFVEVAYGLQLGSASPLYS